MILLVYSECPDQTDAVRICPMTGPKATKLTLNSAAHEICPANKSQITNNTNNKLIIANSSLLNIAEHKNFSANKYENANCYWHFHIYLSEKISCSADLSMKKKFYNLGAWFSHGAAQN